MRGNRRDDRAVLGHRRDPEPRRVVMVLELLVQRPRPLFPQHLDDGDQRAVARRLGDPDVEELVAGERLRVRVELALHRRHRILDRGDLRLLRRFRGKRRALALDHVARAQQFERSGLGVYGGRVVARCALPPARWT